MCWRRKCVKRKKRPKNIKKRPKNTGKSYKSKSDEGKKWVWCHFYHFFFLTRIPAFFPPTIGLPSSTTHSHRHKHVYRAKKKNYPFVVRRLCQCMCMCVSCLLLRRGNEQDGCLPESESLLQKTLSGCHFLMPFPLHIFELKFRLFSETK